MICNFLWQAADLQDLQAEQLYLFKDGDTFKCKIKDQEALKLNLDEDWVTKLNSLWSEEDPGTKQYKESALIEELKIAVFNEAAKNGYAQPKKTISILNAHAPFRDTPKEHEEKLEQVLLNQAKHNDLSVVVGDFNCSVGEPNRKNRNVLTTTTTNIVQPELHPDKIQVAIRTILPLFYVGKAMK